MFILYFIINFIQALTNLEDRYKNKIIQYKGEIDEYMKLTPFLTISYDLDGIKQMQTIRFRLFWDDAPLTCLNFAKILEGSVQKNNIQMTYKNTTFHRIISNFMMQGGSFERINNSQGFCIYGDEDYFEDENGFIKNHTKEGILSMANRGKNTNGSQFFITFDKFPHLDGKHVVFGEVLEIDIKKLGPFKRIKTDKNDRPLYDVTVVNCGLKKEVDKNDEIL